MAGADPYKGEVVAHRRRYFDAMLRLLLQREDARSRPATGPAAGRLYTPEGRKQAEASILKRFKEISHEKRVILWDVGHGPGDPGQGRDRR